jgi:hypothetical protein
VQERLGWNDLELAIIQPDSHSCDHGGDANSTVVQEGVAVGAAVFRRNVALGLHKGIQTDADVGHSAPQRRVDRNPLFHHAGQELFALRNVLVVGVVALLLLFAGTDESVLPNRLGLHCSMVLVSTPVVFLCHVLPFFSYPSSKYADLAIVLAAERSKLTGRGRANVQIK